jgi:UDP-4-amino-4,6-dideoxy-N-acetyl-beta-L-altrosamine N-acetyltransferase
MINDNEISLEDHLHFIDLLSSKSNKRYFLVQEEFDYIGVIDLTEITDSSAELGIYANPDMRGVGNILMTALIDYASALGISKLVANVFITNVRALNLYQKFDFSEIKRIECKNKKMLTLERKL